jgi:hypothetical protein
MTAFSIVGQCHFYCSHKPIIVLLAGDDYSHFNADVLADHITEFSLRALGVTGIEEEVTTNHTNNTKKIQKIHIEEPTHSANS